MKKSMFCLLLATVISGSLAAQLTNSKWKGIIDLGNPVNVSFDFGKDTLAVINLDENSVIETMIYKGTNTSFTIIKITGQSECDTTAVGKYNYLIKDNELLLTAVDDNCEDRRPYLNNLKLTKTSL